MYTFAVIGDPIAHSLSPIMHNAMLKALGRKEEYTKFQVSLGSLPVWLESDEVKNLQGFNVTMPLKNAIIKHLAKISAQAESISAVNTVVCKDDKLYGYNTDGIGFVRALLALQEIRPSTQIALLGSGGSAQAIANALLELNANVCVYCRKPEQAHFHKDIKLSLFENIYTDTEFFQSDIVINATPLGMYQFDQFPSFSFLEKLPYNSIVCDLVYKPRETLLLKEAKAKGYRVLDGIAMLIHQGIAALELFLDEKLDIKEMEMIARKAIERELFQLEKK